MVRLEVVITVRPFMVGFDPGFEMGLYYEISTDERIWNCIIGDSDLVRHPASVERISDGLIEQFRASGAIITDDHAATIRFAMRARCEWLRARERTDHER